MLKYIYVLLFIVLVISCSNNGKHKTAGGTEYIVHHTLGKEKAVKGNILQLRFAFATPDDSMLFSSGNLTDSMLQEYTDMPYGAMTEALGYLAEGDSMTFFFNPDSVFLKIFKTNKPAYFKKDDKLQWHVKVEKKYTREEFTKVIDKRIAQTAAAEDKQIRMYCMANDIKVNPQADGLIYIPFSDGNGKRILPGDTLVVKYTGSFLSGEIFDSSDKGSGALRFVIGKNQMIKGWEEGFLLMSEGGKARFIIPSRLAYGLKGSGPVPADTPILYDVEVVKVYSGRSL